MEYSQVILELLERIKTLEGKVQTLEQKVHALEEAPAPAPAVPAQTLLEKVSRKYRPLAAYLLKENAPVVVLTYPQIESILGFPLPDTAHKLIPQYWANTWTHSYASSWLGVGYKTRVEKGSELVRFVKQPQAPVA